MKTANLRRSLLFAAAAIAVIAALPAPAQSFPSKPLELASHNSPGGGTDIIARLVADIL